MPEYSPGQVIADRYRVVRFLGEGAMSAVYESTDEAAPDKSSVALKILHHEHEQSEEVVVRFEREAKAAGSIASPHVTRVFDVGTVRGCHFLVMELLAGQTLEARLKQKRQLAPEEAAGLVVQLLSGLTEAHALGIVHRDLKPANLMIVRSQDGRDFIKILDFGASKLSGLGTAMTATGAMIGTPMYMSPEQVRSSNQADARADLYACGVILYQCVSGKPPYDVKNPMELAFRIVTQDPTPVESHAPSLDAEFAAIIRKAMARDIDRRYQSAEEMKGALQQWLAAHSAGGEVSGFDAPAPAAPLPAPAPAPAASPPPVQAPVQAPVQMPANAPVQAPVQAPMPAAMQAPAYAPPPVQPSYSAPSMPSRSPQGITLPKALALLVAAGLGVLLVATIVVLVFGE